MSDKAHDGFQIGGANDLIEDEDNFFNKLSESASNIGKSPEEMKD